MKLKSNFTCAALRLIPELLQGLVKQKQRRASRATTQRRQPAACLIESLEDRRLLAGIFSAGDVAVRSGDTAPDVVTANPNGTFADFSQGPVINETGQVLFQANVMNSLNSSDSGLFSISSAGVITTLAREQQSIPTIPGGTFRQGLTNAASYVPLPFNDAGQAPLADRMNGIYYTEDSSLFIANGDGTFTTYAREGSAAPGAVNGTTNGKFGAMENTYVTINQSGQIAFQAWMYDTQNGAADDEAIFMTDANGNLIQVVREGQTIPGSSTTTFTDFYNLSMNNAGQIAFWGSTLNASLPEGIYISNGDGSPLQVVMQDGQTFNTAGEKFNGNAGSSGLISASLINESGAVAFRSHVDDGNNGTIVRSVFVRSGNGELREVVRPGDILSENEIYSDSGIYDIVLNNRGDVAFSGVVHNVIDQSSKSVLYYNDATAGNRGDIQEIVREGQTVPGGNLVVYSITKYTMNDSGQIAFTASLWDGLDSSTTREALFIYDPDHGLHEVVQEGDALDGSTISEIYFAGNNTNIFLENNGDGLNNKGQLTFSYELENGNQGVAVVDVDFSTSIEIRVVETPTTVDAQGETGTVPASQDWIDEWSSYWVEIWVDAGDPNSQGITSVAMDLNYPTDITSATAIEFGPAFSLNQSGTIDDASGSITGLSAETAQTDLGVSEHLLFARIRFESLANDGVDLDLDQQQIGPHDLELAFTSAEVGLVSGLPVTITDSPLQTTSIWANPYDLNDDDAINFRDLLLFASVYGETPSQSQSVYAWFADLNQNDRVEFKDLLLFASNYGKRKLESPAIIYPLNYPDAWNNQLTLAAAVPASQNPTPLSQTAAEEILQTAKTDLTSQLSPEDQLQLDAIQVQVVDLQGSVLGRAAENTIYLDATAAGQGWFIDPTPRDHSEFQQTDDLSLVALPDSDADGLVDLWTVIRHELLHLLGYEHQDQGLLESTLLPGVRKQSDWEQDTDLYFASLQAETELSPF
jgi:hypothetical protein